MDNTNSWISFYTSRKLGDQTKVQMADAKTSSTEKHSWIACDGSKLETSSTFRSFKGTVLGEEENTTKSIPLLSKEALGIDGRMQKVSEQIHWTNSAIQGFEMNMAKTTEKNECFDTIQVVVNNVNKNLNDMNFLVSVLKGFVKESSAQKKEMDKRMDLGLKST